MVFPAHNQTPEVLNPGKQAFNFPSTIVATRFPSVLGVLFTPLFAMWGNLINTAFVQKLFIKSIAVA